METKLTYRNMETRTIWFAGIVFVVIAAFGGGIVIGSQQKSSIAVRAPAELEEALDMQYIQDLYTILRENYIGDLPSKDTLTRGVAAGLVEALGDKYSSYLDPSQAEEYFASNSSAYEGIGVQLGFEEPYTVVVSPMDGSPGAQAGIRAKDIILKVDNEDVTSKRPEVVASKIRGKAGTPVKLTLYRESEDRTFDLTITRKQIDIDNITHSDLGNGIIAIDILKFTEGAQGSLNGAQVFNNEWDKVAKEVASKKPRALVLDLRGNPGGFVSSVRHVAEEFLPTNTIILKERERRSGETTYRDARQGLFENIPIVVVVDEGSASAAEILAAALQENGRAQIVGKATVGKGVEQQLMDLEDQALLILVFRNWLTPNGNQISPESPIKPDKEVEYKPASDKNSKDSQINAALELLNATLR